MKSKRMFLGCLAGVVILAMGYPDGGNRDSQTQFVSAKAEAVAGPKANEPGLKIGVVSIVRALRNCKATVSYRERVNAENGDLLWHVMHESYADENVMIPIFYDGYIFISTLATGSVKWKIAVEDGKVGLEEIWRTKELDNHHGGVVLLDGYLYGTSTVQNSNKWICLDWQTGHMMYADPGIGKGSLTYADGMLYTLGIDRAMGLVRPTSTSFELVGSFEIPEGGKGKSWAHPVVCNGRLYIRHGDFLYAYSVR